MNKQLWSADFLARINTYIDQYALTKGLSRLFVGFSGGADSTCLLHVLRKQNLPLQAVHLHHGLRGKDADADQDWCRDFCARQNIPFVTANLNVPAHQLDGESLEMCGRRLRLSWWQDHLRRENAVAVALGHHQDDQLETLFIRLLRGAGIAELAALRPRRLVKKIWFIRPLLCVSRDEIRQYLRQQGINWREDASNTDTDFLRNRIRHELLPVLQRIAGNRKQPYTALERLGAEADYLTTRLEAERPAFFSQTLPLSGFSALPEALRFYTLNNWLAQLDPPVAAESRRLRALDRLIRQNHAAASVNLDAMRVARVRNDVLQAESHPAPPLDFLPLPWNWVNTPLLDIPAAGLQLHARRLPRNAVCFGQAGQEVFSPKQLPETLLIRPRQPGDRMRPFGGDKEVRLKKLIQVALPVEKRHRLVVVCAPDNEIIWVPGIRRAAIAEVGPTDQEVILLTVRSQ